MRPLFVFAATLLAAVPEWTPQASGVTARLRGVSAVNERVAWASGANGTIVRTSDGGLTWRRLTIPGTEALDFRDIDAVDERTAYALSIGPGEASRIYKTRDAGVTWQLQFKNSDPKAFFDAMTFWSATRGIAISDSVDGRFVLLSTEDGGGTWARVAADGLPPALPEEGAFAASGTNIAVHGKRHVWIGTGAGRVLRSGDGGRSWEIAVTGLATSPSAGIFSIAFRDERHGIAVGGDYKLESRAVDNAAVTDDGGRSWRSVAGLGGLRSVVTWLPRSGGWLAVGPSGSDISHDDGRTWAPVAGPGYHAFSPAPGGRVGWGVGESGRIGRLGW
ncbi:MAG: WD40/YVTN/BNR-like repeat-containing protein [Bryobacteraceae bacterium]